MDIIEIVNGLNDAQRQAVTAKEQPLLVLAGAGSGKTRVLVHRMAWLINSGYVSEQGLLAVTFTNKAAREMRERMTQLLKRSAQSLWIGTFHSLAHRLLRYHWQEAGLTNNFQIMDADDQLRLIKRILREQKIDENQYTPKQVQWYINKQKDAGIRAQYVQGIKSPYERTLFSIYQLYENQCQQNALVDFAEILLRSHELWLKNPALLHHYRRRFRHVLVDEFQDTNAVQYAWLQMLTKNTEPDFSCDNFIMAVGDDDQSIYGWRGAKIENIQKFEQDFNNTLTLRLEQNYRSTQTILRAANEVIRHNRGRLGKELWTQGTQGDPIVLYEGFNEKDEAYFISDKIKKLLQGSQKASEIAVLYRSNAQSRVLEESLIQNTIPYRIYGGQRFYDRLEIKNALAYLRLIIFRQDDAAFERVINTPTRGIGDRTLAAVREHARTLNIALWDAAIAIIAQQQLPVRAANALNQFLYLINTLSEQTQGLTLAEQIEHVITHSGLIAFHEKEKGEKAQARIENLQELISAAQAFNAENSETVTLEEDTELMAQLPLKSFLDEAALNGSETEDKTSKDSVQLMTLHSAKGLEFEQVFLCGMEEGLFPHKMSQDDPERLEEERRLCYVGITRAKKQLYMSYAEHRKLHGQEYSGRLSRFVKEIPTELLNETRIKSHVSRPVSHQRSFIETSSISNADFSLGQEVMHPVFGEGVILNFEGSDSQARVQVKFKREGTKWLVLAYAKLAHCTTI